VPGAHTVNDHAGNGDLGGERYRTLVDSCPYAICVHQGGRVVYVNPAGVRWMAAQSADQLVGARITDYVHPNSIPPMLARVAALRHDGDASRPSEVVMLRCDGTVLDVEAVTVLTVWEGKPAFQVSFRDVTAQKAAQATLRYQAALVTHVSDAIIATTFTGVITSWNPAAEAIYRRPPAQALGIPVSEAVGALLDPAAIIADGGVANATHRGADGSALAVRVSAAAMDDGYVLVCTDRTALRRAEQHFQTVVTLLDEGVAVMDRDGRLEFRNPAALRILGLPAEGLGGVRRILDVPLYDINGDPLDADRHPLAQILQDGTPVNNCVYGVDRTDGQRIWLSGSHRLLNPEDPEHSAVLTSFSDITAQRAASERLAHEAAHDALTGLPNRTQVVARVAQVLGSGRPQVLAAVLFIDLDNFKSINDSLGHDAGDDVLRIVAQRLRRAVRSDDVIGRIGGDEFVALLVGQITGPDLSHLDDRLHATLSEPVVIDTVTLRIGASIGIVVVEHNDQRSAAEILRDADNAMYEAKTTGRGRSQYFTEQLREKMRQRLTKQQNPLVRHNRTRRRL
jgi:diguanylate cyclase (GGDEF)-like protein/PAS domain S-box-containing protein